jgi:glycosyltransferase involved in cell wall biosynthesis
MDEVITIISTAHWDGDPRLNRHITYLSKSGHAVTLVTFADGGRVRAWGGALRAISRAKAGYVLLPDPELFAVGSLVARFTGKRSIIDIHEDYARTAMARSWVPDPLRPLVSALARTAVWLGRICATRVMVAAPELSNGRDSVVLNLPDPGSLTPPSHLARSSRLVYVGDITPERGIDMMLESIAALDESFELLLIGRVSPEAANRIETTTNRLGLTERVIVEGRLPHDEAWELASGCLAGLSLLRDVPAYRDAVATKLWEYLAVGLPPVVTSLPGQGAVASRIDPRLVCSSAEDVADVVRLLASDPDLRRDLGVEARRLVEEKWATNRPDLAVQSLLVP